MRRDSQEWTTQKLLLTPLYQSTSPSRSMSNAPSNEISELLQRGFPNPFWAPHDGTGIRVRSDLPSHEIHAKLHSPSVEDCEATFTGSPTAPRSFNRLRSHQARHFPTICQFGCCTSGIPYLRRTTPVCRGGGRSLDWVNTLHARHPANQHLALELDSLFQRVRWYGCLAGKRREDRPGAV